LRLFVVFLDSDTWSNVLEEAAAILASGLLLSNDIRRDARVCLVKRWYGDYEWLCVDGSAVRNLRPDIESAKGLVRAFLRGHGWGAARVGIGLPRLVGKAFEVRAGKVLAKPRCPEDMSIIMNHRGEYGVLEPLTVPPPPRLTPHMVAAVNILLDNVCHDMPGSSSGGASV